MSIKIGFAGMTHLGINHAVATAERGFQVLCVDNDPKTIASLEQANPAISEPLLVDYMLKNQKRLKYSSHLKNLATCDVVYIAADVPTNDQGTSDLGDIKALIAQVLEHLSSSAILVILCQVPPGFTRNISLAKDRLFYQVETLIFGEAIKRALEPERFIIGCENPSVPLPLNYQTLLQAFDCPILPMRYESAELAKISINCCLVASISVANTLSEICENIGADWSEIVPALKRDRRIGAFAYLSPGLGLAGGNLERDLCTVLNISEEYGTETGVVSAWVKNSQYRRDWVLRVLHQHFLVKNSDPLLAVLGLTYKENTHSLKNSPSIALLKSLGQYRVKAFDPVISASGLNTVMPAESLEKALENADALIIMTPWSDFKKLEPKLLLQKMQGRLVIDPYRILNGKMLQEAGFTYLTLGVPVAC